MNILLTVAITFYVNIQQWTDCSHLRHMKHHQSCGEQFHKSPALVEVKKINIFSLYSASLRVTVLRND